KSLLQHMGGGDNKSDVAEVHNEAGGHPIPLWVADRTKHKRNRVRRELAVHRPNPVRRLGHLAAGAHRRPQSERRATASAPTQCPSRSSGCAPSRSCKT